MVFVHRVEILKKSPPIVMLECNCYRAKTEVCMRGKKTTLLPFFNIEHWKTIMHKTISMAAIILELFLYCCAVHFCHFYFQTPLLITTF